MKKTTLFADLNPDSNRVGSDDDDFVGVSAVGVVSGGIEVGTVPTETGNDAYSYDVDHRKSYYGEAVRFSYSATAPELDDDPLAVCGSLLTVTSTVEVNDFWKILFPFASYQ